MIFWVFRGIKGQKIVQNDKNSVRHAPYLRNHTLCDCHLWFTWLSFMFTSPDIFFSFSKVWFFRLLGGGKRTKNSPKWCKKFCLVMLYILGTIPHMIVIYGTHVWNDNISRVFFTFWKFWFAWFLEGLQSKIWFKMTKICQSCSISQEPNIIWLSFMVHVYVPHLLHMCVIFLKICSLYRPLLINSVHPTPNPPSFYWGNLNLLPSFQKEGAWEDLNFERGLLEKRG